MRWVLYLHDGAFKLPVVPSRWLSHSLARRGRPAHGRAHPHSD
jgi:hypothetical protein